MWRDDMKKEWEEKEGMEREWKEEVKKKEWKEEMKRWCIENEKK